MFFSIGVFALVLLILTTVNTYIQHKSIKEIALNDAHQSAELVFESLYSVMKNGWSKEEIDEIVQRFNNKLPDMHLRLVRSKGVADLYGDTPVAKEARENDPLIKATFKSKQQTIEEVGNDLRFIYPVRAQAECMDCHDNARTGDVNGIIEVTFAYDAIAVPMEYAINSVVLIFGVLFCVLFFIVIVSIKYFMVKPIVLLSEHMSDLRKGDETEVGSAPRSGLYEVDFLCQNFNDLMGHLKDAHKELEDLTIKDPLTGLSNRRHFDEVLAQEIERATRYQHVFSIIMVDLDKFKPINDTYGHDAGDMVLKAVAMNLSTHLRITDLVARVGGDEFQVIAPEIDETHVGPLAEKIRHSVSDASVDFKGQALGVSCSVGVATFGVDASEAGELHRIADQRMYEDKRARKQGRE